MRRAYRLELWWLGLPDSAKRDMLLTAIVLLVALLATCCAPTAVVSPVAVV